jgi:hypothetical protein
VPVALIAQVSALLADRVVHLRVTGTVRSPTVRLDPVRLLTDEAVRFFLYNVVFPVPGAPAAP